MTQISNEDVIATEEFIEHAVAKTEISTLNWVLNMLKRYEVKDVESQIKQYIKELEDE